MIFWSDLTTLSEAILNTVKGIQIYQHNLHLTHNWKSVNVYSLIQMKECKTGESLRFYFKEMV